MVLSRRFSRREVLRIGGAATAAAMLHVTRWPSFAGAAGALRSEWQFVDGLPTSGDWESPVLQPESGFDSVDVSWDAAASDDEAVAIAVRVGAKDGSWSDWITLHPDHHGDTGTETRRYAAPILSQGVSAQVRVSVADGTGLREIVVGTLDTSSTAVGSAMTADQAVAQAILIDGMIIPRSGWGADEKLRFKDQDPTGPMIWPPSYAPIEKIIVHHTVTENNPPDPLASIRSVYYYHAITRGWGDIGYNFLVDWQGRIYEGRFGGPNVIGGHSLQYNNGSIGIALLGNFDVANPPQAMLDAVASIVWNRAPNVDVTSAADFHDLEDCPNLCGHRDVLSTSCPGDLCYPLLPRLRGTIAGTGPIYLAPPVQPAPPPPSEPSPSISGGLEVVSCEIGPATIYQGNLLEVRMQVRNSGGTTIRSGGPEPGFIYDEGQNFDTAGYPKVEGEYRITLQQQSWTGTPNPWRWGLGGSLPAGETRTITGFVRLRSLGTDEFRAAVVQEFVAYTHTGLAPTRVTVAAPPVTPVAQQRDPGTRFFEITGHNVPSQFADYWDANGGVERFGYPLTEAFVEVSETDGGSYLTQYFERARFEYHPEYIGTDDEVLLGLLGSETTVNRRNERAFQRVTPFTSDADHGYFDKTGHSLSNAFKAFWERNGGLPVFGYPISEEFREQSETDGKEHIVQYFERNRFEYHPDYAGTKDEVMLGHLAREVLIRRGWIKRDE